MNFLHSFLKRKAEDTIEQVSFTSLNDLGKIPTKSHELDAGYDLYSIADCIIKPGRSELIHTSIRVEFPKGFCGIIFGRSGLAARHSILVHSGIIDYGYSGELGIVLFNLGETEYKILKGDRVAQLVITKIFPPVSGITASRTGERADSGFGSSGN